HYCNSTVTLHTMKSSIAVLLSLASVASALQFTDRVVERSPTHETVALTPVDLAALPAWDQEAFERSHPELTRATASPRSAMHDRFVPGQVLFGNGGFFPFTQHPMMMGAPLFVVPQPVQLPSLVSSDSSNFKWSSIQTDGDREISVIQ
ncbi:hypothetical protein PMAYCL1PPCAC_19091, partial [Pristionchus mayeri]